LLVYALSHDLVSISDNIAPSDRLISESIFGKYMEESDHCLICGTVQNFLGETEEEHDKPQTVFAPRGNLNLETPEWEA
jgi:hypothetical protein